jgi:tetratricopeptide (TPR) repeat protein
MTPTPSGETDTEPRLGRYERLEELARGGSGSVARARDRETGEIVAVKILRRVDPNELEALRREVHALRRISHPGIVSVLDSGLDDSPPWYAMELIEGGTLYDTWERERDGATPSPQLVARSLGLINRVCEPLAFLHAEGIVHRDLKPENIGIRGNDDPVIVDFGLVSQFGAALAREELESGGWIAGTIRYMAPEQARGEYVDARADLYSLGCILYEAVTGRPPFVGTAAQVLQQHLEAEPEPVDGADPKLAELIGRLLAKDPRDRIGYAEDVAAVLRELGFASGEAPRRRGRTYLYRPSFTGRKPEFLRLCRALDDAKGGRGSLLLVAGESGVGKTRFAMEATREAAARGFRVLTGECAPMEEATAEAPVRGAPLHPLRPLLRAVADECTLEGTAASERLLGSRAKVLAPYEPALARVPGFADQPDPPDVSATGQRGRALSDLSATLAELARDEPLLLVLDDLQWADDMTLAWIHGLGRGFVASTRVLLLGTYRREEVSPHLERIVEERPEDVLEIPRLDASGVSSIVTDMLGAETPPQALARVLERESEGNPFFVCEYLHAAIEARLLKREVGGRWVVESSDQTGDPVRGSLPLPSTLRELVRQRLGELDPLTSRVLEAAAVLGRDFDAGLAETLADLDRQEGSEAFRQLLQRRVLETAEPGRFRFAHDKLREVAYSRISEPRMIGLHRGAAAAIEESHAGEAIFEGHFVELANHWLKAGDGEKAIEYFSRAGEHALETGAYNDAHHWIARALGLDEQRGRRAGVFQRSCWQRMLGAAAFGIGDLATSIRYSAEALSGFNERVPETRLGWARVVAWEATARALRRRPRVVQPDERMRQVASGCGQLATSYFYEGDALPACASLLRGLSWAERAGDEALVLEACARLGLVSGTLRLHRLARGWFERAYSTSRRIDAPGGRGLTLYLDAQYQQGLGRWETAHAVAAESAELLNGIGDHQEAEVARTVAANNLFYAGEIDRANRAIAHTGESADRRAHSQHVAWSHFLRARSALVTGDLDLAIAECAQALPLLTPLPDILSLAMCEGTYAAALWRAGQREESIALADQLARRLADGRGPLISQCLDGYGALAEVYLSRLEEAADGPERERAAAAAKSACRSLRWFARVFPMAVPAAHRSTARERWIRGSHSGARRAWRRSLHAAQELGMPFWEACAHQDLALRAAGADERSQHHSNAERIFRSLGAVGYLAELESS